jgi:hypothetical protein
MGNAVAQEANYVAVHKGLWRLGWERQGQAKKSKGCKVRENGVTETHGHS